MKQSLKQSKQTNNIDWQTKKTKIANLFVTNNAEEIKRREKPVGNNEASLKISKIRTE